MKFSVIMPCYNERATLATIVGRVLEAPPAGAERELVIVDDCSTDGSRQILERLARRHPEIKALYHDRNRGKGASIRTAQKETTGDIVVIQDADLEYSPECYPDLFGPITGGHADVVYGSRFLGGGPHRALFFRHAVANRLLTTLSNLTTDLYLTDMETCYKAFRGVLFREIPLQSNRFGFEPEITAKVAKLGLRVYEVPVEYHGRTHHAGKKIGWTDGVAALYTILKYWVFDGLSGMGEGLEALQVMHRARRYNEWLFGRIAPYLGDRIIEAGSGIGNLTVHLLNREMVLALDSNPQYAERLGHILADNPNVEVREFDLTDTAAYGGIRDLKADTVLCVNVLEHLEPDSQVLGAFHDVLVPGGRAVILVPAGPWMYGAIDRAVGHHRRYSRRDLSEKLASAGFEVERMFGLNRLSSLGWFVNSRILRRKKVPDFQVKLVDNLMTFVRVLEFVLPLPPLSLVAVGRRK